MNLRWKEFIKVLTVLTVILGVSTNLFSQKLKTANSISSKITDKTNFYEVQKNLKEYWKNKNAENGYTIKNGENSKVPNWKRYQRWEYYWEQRVNQKTGEFPRTTSIDEYQKYLSQHPSLRKENAFNESWTNLGTNSSTGGYAGIGRINCIAFHPSDANTFWVGSPSGGIWETTDGGSNWAILNDDQSVLGVSSIIVPSDFATSNTLYIATGDRDGGSMWSLSGGQVADNASIGVLKSTDGGSTWNTTGLTFSVSDKKLVYKLLIHPSNNAILLASTSDGIYKSTDSGANWSLKTPNKWVDMEFKPGDPTVVYASSYNYTGTYVNLSTDTGDNWNIVNSGTSVATNGRRGELAVSSNDPTVVYLLAANAYGGVDGIYKSTDSGVNWSNQWAGSPSGMCGYYTDGSGGSGGQGSYDLCMAVDPTDINTIYIGGITTWKSTDGGVNWTALNNWTSYALYNISGIPVVHADKHALAFQSNSVLFEGNDGGIYKTTNGGTSWTDLSNGMVISQIYRLGVSQTSSSTIITGLQDNGSKLYNSGTWSDVTGGDGMECIVDFNDANYQYATYVRGRIYRTTNNWASYSTISSNIPGGQPTGAWVTPYVMDPNDNQTIIAAYDSVWKSTNRGTTWTGISQELSNVNKIRSLAVAPSNSNVIYCADPTNMWKTTDGGATAWSSVTLPATTNYLTYIAVKNDDPNTLWITFGGYTSGEKVYESTDGGGSWTSISTGLPNIPVMSIVQHKDFTSKNVLFVGTDVGVYVKDGANDWASYSTGLPNVVVTELEIYYNNSGNKLRAATFGRGLWETDISAPLPVELSAFTANVSGGAVVLNWTTDTEVNNYGFEIERALNKSDPASSNSDYAAVNWGKIGFVAGAGNSNSTKQYSYEDKNISSGQYYYRLKQIDIDGQFKYSETAEVTANYIPGKYALEQNYPNPFNPSTTIPYQIKDKGIVQIKIYNLLGQEITTLVNEVKAGGAYTAVFDAKGLPSGVYYYSISVNDFTQSKKMILLR